MPLTLKGRRVLRNMKKEYGEKKGKQVFYAWENKHKNDRSLFGRRKKNT